MSLRPVVIIAGILTMLIAGHAAGMTGYYPQVVNGQDYRVAMGQYHLGFVEILEYVYDPKLKAPSLQHTTFLDGGALGEVRVSVSARGGTIGLLAIAGAIAAWLAWGCVRQWKRHAKRRRQPRGFEVGEAGTTSTH